MFYTMLCVKDNFFYVLIKDIAKIFKYDNIYRFCMNYYQQGQGQTQLRHRKPQHSLF